MAWAYYSCGKGGGGVAQRKTKNYIDVFIGNSQQDVWRFTGFMENLVGKINICRGNTCESCMLLLILHGW